jgi:hypothetical protein
MGKMMGDMKKKEMMEEMNMKIEKMKGGFEWNVEEVIKNEMRMDGSMELNLYKNNKKQRIKK